MIYPYKDIIIRPDDFRIVPYSLGLAQRPCRAQHIVRGAWWVCTDRYGIPSVLFLNSHSGHIPQQSVDEEVINILKRKIFPWADVKLLPQVYLVKHGTEGYEVPYGRVN